METKVNEKSAKAYVEILEIIKYMEPECVNKIPKGLIEFFERQKDKNYEYHFDEEKDFSEQKISEETGGLLAMLALNYIANEENKEKIKEILIKNEEEYQKELREKYNPDNLFKDKQNIEENEPKQIILVEEKPWYKKILNKIKRFFVRKWVKEKKWNY